MTFEDQFTAAWLQAADMVNAKNHDPFLVPPAMQTGRRCLDLLMESTITLKEDASERALLLFASAYIHGYLTAELLHENTEETETVH